MEKNCSTVSSARLLSRTIPAKRRLGLWIRCRIGSAILCPFHTLSKFMLERYVHSGRNDPAKALLSDIRIDRTIKANGGKTTALAAASWLVMTHHRLPAAAVKLLSSPSPVPHEYTLINQATEPTGGTISVDPRLADPVFLDALASLDADCLARG